jgi:hypothetical protein
VHLAVATTFYKKKQRHKALKCWKTPTSSQQGRFKNISGPSAKICLGNQLMSCAELIIQKDLCRNLEIKYIDTESEMKKKSRLSLKSYQMVGPYTTEQIYGRKTSAPYQEIPVVTFSF